MSVVSGKSKEIKSLGETLIKECKKETPSAETCLDILKTLFSQSFRSSPKNSNAKRQGDGDCIITLIILQETLVGKCLTKANKAFRKQKRSSQSSNEKNVHQWKECIDITDSLLREFKKVAAAGSVDPSNDSDENETGAFDNGDTSDSLPANTTIYRTRLIQQKKEMYKDPPVLPPQAVEIFHEMNDTDYPLLPKRSRKTMELTFTLPPSMLEDGSYQQLETLLKDFKPNRTPEEILRAGSFGGTYFRPITSAVTNITYKPKEVLSNTVQPSWIANLNSKTMLTSLTYRPAINKYKAKCGGSLGMWESSGWITNIDPYGWFQWYCRFYQGRRSSDDVRQIQRWCKSAGSKGRFRSQLCNKILNAGGVRSMNDTNISPVIRQTLLHWGLEITEHVIKAHAKRVGK